MKKVYLTAIIFLSVIMAVAIYLILTDAKIPDNIICAKEGEAYSKVYKTQYPEYCCKGLKEWSSGMDTRISVDGICYGTLQASGNPVGTCINCGNGVCENKEDVCNCPEDCKGKEHSTFSSVDEFCRVYGNGTGLADSCKEFSDLPICELCTWN